MTDLHNKLVDSDLYDTDYIPGMSLNKPSKIYKKNNKRKFSHPQDNFVKIKTTKIRRSKVHKCLHCDKLYSSIQSLKNHISSRHNTKKKSINCKICDYKTKSPLCLVNHTQKEHSEHNLFYCKRFDNHDKATDFLNDIIHDGQYSFTKTTGKKSHRDRTTEYYACNQFEENNNCPCFIKYVKTKGVIEITFQNLHNHPPNIDKAKISKKQKKILYNKIKDDVSINKIYQKLTANIDLENISKLQTITKNYLRTLRSEYTNKFRINKNDFKSAESYLKSLLYDGKISNYMLKRKNEIDPIAKNVTSNFILAYQTTSQFQTLSSESPKFLMADATHSTNIYGFYLITFAVLTGKQRFLPILTILTDSESEHTISYVLKNFKQKNLIPKTITTLISDMSHVYINSWKSSFNAKIQWLYCNWHFKCAIYKNINIRVRDDNDRMFIKNTFRKMMRTYDKKEFNKKYKNFMKQIQQRNKSFYDYFIKNYGSCIERWAAPFRIKTEVNNNMFLESFHGAFKSGFLGKQSKNRLDSLLMMLISYDDQRSLIYYLNTTSKNKEFMGFREKNSLKKHKKSLKLKDSAFKIRNNVFYYKKYKIEKGPCVNCPNKSYCLCKICGICKDCYQCTCYSYMIKKEQCKHIHKVHSLLKRRETADKRNFKNLTVETAKSHTQTIPNISLNSNSKQRNLSQVSKSHENQINDNKVEHFFKRNQNFSIVKEDIHIKNKSIALLAKTKKLKQKIRKTKSLVYINKLDSILNTSLCISEESDSEPFSHEKVDKNMFKKPTRQRRYKNKS